MSHVKYAPAGFHKAISVLNECGPETAKKAFTEACAILAGSAASSSLDSFLDELLGGKNIDAEDIRNTANAINFICSPLIAGDGQSNLGVSISVEKTLSTLKKTTSISPDVLASIHAALEAGVSESAANVTASNMPRLVDFRWSLNVQTATSVCKQAVQPIITMDFVTQDRSGVRKSNQVDCTVEEFEAVLSKVVDAHAAMESV